MCKNPKEYHMCEKDYIWNHATCSCKNGKYVLLTEDSVTMCNKIIKRTVLYNFMALWHFALENYIFEIDEFCSVIIFEEDAKIKHKICILTKIKI